MKFAFYAGKVGRKKTGTIIRPGVEGFGGARKSGEQPRGHGPGFAFMVTNNNGGMLRENLYFDFVLFLAGRISLLFYEF